MNTEGPGRVLVLPVVSSTWTTLGVAELVPKVLGVYGLDLKLQVDSLWVNVGQQDVLSDFHSVWKKKNESKNLGFIF